MKKGNRQHWLDIFTQKKEGLQIVNVHWFMTILKSTWVHVSRSLFSKGNATDKINVPQSPIIGLSPGLTLLGNGNCGDILFMIY